MTDQLRHSNSVRGSDFRQRLFFAVVAVTLLLGILPGKASGQTLSLSQTSGAAGITVTATAAGFAADIPAGLKPNTGFYVCADGCPFGPGFLGACPAPVGVDGWANCSIQLTIPTDVGQYTMSARNSAGEYASQVFTALPPTLNISPTCGSSGTTIAATGSNWSVGLDAGIYVDGSLLQNILNYPSSSGTFSQSFTLPSSVDGPHTIRVANSAREDLSMAFTTPVCPVVGTVTELTGTAMDGSVQLQPGSTVYLNDTISTKPNSSVLITFTDGMELRVSQNSNFALNEYAFDSASHQGNSFFSALQGAFQYTSGLIAPTLPDNKTIRIDCGIGETCAYIGIRGTQFITRPSAANSEEIDLISGTVALTPSQTGTTTAFTGPITIVFNGTGTTTSTLTQDQYNAILAALFPSPATDAAPPIVNVSFGVAPSGQAGFYNASQTPVLGNVSASDRSNVAAISCVDSLGGLTAGALTGGGTGSASETLSVNGNGSHSLSCTATDGTNNIGAATGSSNTAVIHIDNTPPTISGGATPAANSYGWNNTNVTVNFSCSDALSGIAACSGATTLTAQGAGASVTGTAVDGAGNTAQTQVTVNIDQTNPVVTYTGGGTYTVEQTVNISCAASDALSGIASATCGPNVTGPAYSYALGTVYNYSATATDKAGNVGKGSTSFTVTVGTALNLANLVRKFELKTTIAATMVSTLQSAYTAFASGNVKSGDNQLSAFISQVIAQQGKSLTVTQANLLIQYAKALME